MGQDLKYPNILLYDDAVLFNEKKHNLLITKEHILKEYNVFNEMELSQGINKTLSRRRTINQSDMHPDQWQSNSNQNTKKCSSGYAMKVSAHQHRSTLNGPTP